MVKKFLLLAFLMGSMSHAVVNRVDRQAASVSGNEASNEAQAVVMRMSPLRHLCWLEAQRPDPESVKRNRRVFFALCGSFVMMVLQKLIF